VIYSFKNLIQINFLNVFVKVKVIEEGVVASEICLTLAESESCPVS